MSKLKLVFLILLITDLAFAQEDIRTSASIQVQEMIDFYNKKEIPKYVDFLLPVYYGNDNKNKTKFSEMWEMILKNDTDNFKLEELLELNKSDNQDQVLFQISSGNRKSYIIGISDDNGKKWNFTQSINENAQFDGLLQTIPTLNHSFADNIDPKFGKRINYKIGKTISPFNFIDINGNEISSNTIKNKIIVLNFWGVWCAPCVQEIPELNKLVEKYSDKNVKFIAPAVNSSKENLLNKFLPKHPFLYDIVVVNGDDYAINSFPTHIVINQKNEVIDIITGYSEENIKKLENIIASNQ